MNAYLHNIAFKLVYEALSEKLRPMIFEYGFLK